MTIPPGRTRLLAPWLTLAMIACGDASQSVIPMDPPPTVTRYTLHYDSLEHAARPEFQATDPDGPVALTCTGGLQTPNGRWSLGATGTQALQLDLSFIGHPHSWAFSGWSYCTASQGGVSVTDSLFLSKASQADALPEADIQFDSLAGDGRTIRVRYTRTDDWRVFFDNVRYNTAEVFAGSVMVTQHDSLSGQRLTDSTTITFPGPGQYWVLRRVHDDGGHGVGYRSVPFTVQ